MRRYSRIEKQPDFAVPLLEVLADMPGHQGQAGTVVAEVIDRYGRFMTSDMFEDLPSGGQRCDKHIRWQRFVLDRLGFMDSPRPGLWHITDEGVEWLHDNPDSTSINLHLTQAEAKRRKQPRVVRKPVRMRKEPDDGEQKRWLEVIGREVRSAREFLRGRASRPSDERLCDLVQLCYTLELYEEARDLFAVIDSSSVNRWLYERTSRLARICAMKVGE